MSKRVHRLLANTTSLVFLSVALGSIGANAQESSGELDWSSIDERTTFSVFFENDVLLANEDDDQNYTMGLALEWSGRVVGRYNLNRPRIWVDRVLSINKLHDKSRADSPISREMFQIGVSAFTPNELRDPSPQPDDRPYASILYFVSKHQSVREDRRSALTSELSIGILGLEIADWFQTWLHEELQDFPGDTPYTPAGWHLQISDGGELTARYALKYQGLLSCRKNIDFQWNAEGHVGYYTNASVGGAVRLGRISSPWWSFSPAPITDTKLFVANVSPDSDDPCPTRSYDDSELYIWGGLSGRAWLYNALLQGQFRSSPVTVDSSNIERFVGEYQVGLSGTAKFWGFRHSLSYAYARRTAEFDGPLRRAHSWGGLYYSVSRAF